MFTKQTLNPTIRLTKETNPFVCSLFALKSQFVCSFFVLIKILNLKAVVDL